MWPNPQLLADLVTFTEQILNGRLYFLCSVVKKLVTHKASVLTAWNFWPYTGLYHVLWAWDMKFF